MSPERWQRIDKLFHAALERSPENRQAFLEGACDQDSELQQEIYSLLAAADQSNGALDASPLPLAPVLAGDKSQSDSGASLVGQTFDHYRIECKVGEGGYGVVYKARDTRLDRLVALKLLRVRPAADPDRKRRFVQEAKAASALNHPNIITVHDIGSDGGVDFIVMEFISGKTLGQLIGRKGLPVETALKYSVQIADALAAAHAADIVHRDLKPGNVMVTASGLVKVLDFGLAKLSEPDSSGTASGRTTGPVTEAGMIVGTAAYMSPEQARGDELDARTDLFSLGIVLYELATGKMPFEGKTSATLIRAILHDTPLPPSHINAAIPPKLEEIISKALEKDREVRYQHAADLRSDLKRLERDLDSRQVSSTPGIRARAAWRKGQKMFATIFGAVAVAAAGGLLGSLLSKPLPAPRILATTQITNDGRAKIAYT
jgi:serine/threonine protein kinase